MAAPVTDLSEDQIARLLLEAEERLAGKDAAQTVDARRKKQALQSTTSRPALEPTGSARAALEHEELTVRTPQHAPRKDKKGSRDDAGPDWFHMPKTQLDPLKKRDLQMLRLRSVLDPKRHWRKDTRKDFVPQFSQFGTLEEGRETLGGSLTRRERKRTIVEEVLGTGEANSKFKTRYDEIQVRKMSGKKGYYKKFVAQRRRS